MLIDPFSRSLSIHGMFAPYGKKRAFSLESLFSSGEQGGCYDPSDLSTLFQDSAGATPVTATGQSVRLMRDKSGNSNHLTAPSDAARPVLRQDGNGKYYLDFDGVDDGMLSANLFKLNAEWFCAVAAVIGDLTGTAALNQYFGQDSGDDTNRSGIYMRASGAGGASQIGIKFRINTGTNFSTYVSSAFTVGVPFVALARHESTTLYINVGASSNSTAADYGITESTGNIAIMLTGSDARFYFYGGVFVDQASTSSLRSQTEIYLAAKSGVTLS